MGLFGKKKKARTPVEQPDSGRSKQFIRIVEALCEGEIEGLVNGEQSVYLDNTPLKNADGSYNFSNVILDGQEGTQDQDVMVGFDLTEREISVGTEVRKRTPLTKTVTDRNVTRLRLTLGVSSLFRQENNGDTKGSEINFKVTVGSRVINFGISGKYSSQYLKNLMIDNLPPVPFNIKVERVEADSTSQRLQNKTIWASYTEIIDTKFAYPNTALIGIKLDSEYFSNIPSREYEIFGQKVEVPNGYDPKERTYPNLWDGTFVKKYTDNPLWILRDIVVNKRFGLWRHYVDFTVDKWAFYQAAQYCDQLIPDGYGGTEPRFTCNIWEYEQRKFYDVISDICSIFRAMPVWDGTQLTVIMDRPGDPVWTYTNANVINGEFSRQYSAMKSRHNAIQVEYKNKDNNYEKEIEYISNDADIKKNGFNLKKVTAFGCTSRGQAYRTGRWILETERLETEAITFSVGAEGLMHIPGDIIRVADNHFAGTDIGGRVLAISGRQVTLDREITLTGNSYFSYINNHARHSNIRIVSVAGKVITLSNEPTGLAEMDVWSLTTQAVTSRLYRAMSIAENDDGSYTITALQHEPQKESIVDNGASFEPVNQTLHNTGIANIISANADYIENGVKLSWDMPSVLGAVKYQIRLYRNGKLYSTNLNLESTEFIFENLPDGSYTAEIRARGTNGQLSDPVTRTFEINLTIPRFITKSLLFAIELDWDLPKTATVGNYVELWRSATNNIGEAVKIATLPYPQNNYTINGVSLSESYYFWARCGDKNGHKGGFTEAVFGEADHNPDTLLNALEGQITRSQLGESLINSLQNDIDVSVDAEAKSRQTAVAGVIAQIQAEAMARGNAITTLQNVDQQQAQQIATVTTKAENALSGIREEQQARAQGDKSNADKISAITARVGNAESAIVDMRTAKADKNEVATIAHTALQSQWQSDINSAKQSAISSAATDAQTKADQAKREAVTASERAAQAKADAAKAQAIASASNDATSKANAAKAQAIADAAAKDEAVKRQAAQDAQTKANTAKAEAIAEAQRLNQATSAKIDTVQRTLANADRANAESIKTVTAAMGETKAQVSTVSNAVTTLTGKLQATHTIKTQTVAGGRKAIAGIALGTSSDGITAESSVIVMADKFGIVADVNDGNVKPVFSVANGQVGIRGDLVVAGSVTHDKMSFGGGANLLSNPIFANSHYGWDAFTNNGSRLISDESGQLSDPWSPPSYLQTENIGRLRLSNIGRVGRERLGGFIQYSLPVKPNAYYVASAYLGGHECEAHVDVDIRTANGGWGGKQVLVDSGRSALRFNNGLPNAKRCFIVFKTPVNAIKLDFIVAAYANTSRGDAVLFAMRPMLEECTEHTREPSPWANAGVTQVHGGSIIANTIRGEHIQANQRIQAPNINGGTITGNVINGTQITGSNILGTIINGGNIVGTNISGVTIRGSHLEGATGSFTGTLTVGQLIGSNILEVVTLDNVKYSTETRGPKDNRKTYGIYSREINIKPSPVDRFFTILNSDITAIIPANQSEIIQYRKEIHQAIGGERPPEIQHDSSIRMTVLLIAMTSPKTVS